MSELRVLASALGGGALARRVIAGDAPASWYERRPGSPSEWRERAEEVRRSAPGGWLTALSDAFGAEDCIPARLDRVAAEGGVVVTTGQQPGLFGGPIYTWSKAIAALELADAIERATGVPAAPVFWAATDDADLAEASDTWVALPGGARRLAMHVEHSDGVSMSDAPLGDVSAELRMLADASGSALDPEILEAVRRAYHREATVGGAYVSLLRALFPPLGVAVLDASHPALLQAGRPLLVRALRASAEIAAAAADRSHELRATGVEPQVADVEGLSLVFTRVHGRKVRIPVSEARGVAVHGNELPLTPNVLLRPVLERALLPTVGYVAGPGELAYFAQVSAVAHALGAEKPLAVPRWSCTILEPHVQELLARYQVTGAELAAPHAVEGRLARERVAVPVMAALESLRAGIAASTRALRDSLEADGTLVDGRVVEGTERALEWRASRLERRVIAAAKRREAGVMRDIATARGALYPNGVRQERALNLTPFLARYGPAVVGAMRASARRHAEALVQGGALPVDEA